MKKILSSVLALFCLISLSGTLIANGEKSTEKTVEDLFIIEKNSTYYSNGFDDYFKSHSPVTKKNVAQIKEKEEGKKVYFDAKIIEKLDIKQKKFLLEDETGQIEAYIDNESLEKFPINNETNFEFWAEVIKVDGKNALKITRIVKG